MELSIVVCVLADFIIGVTGLKLDGGVGVVRVTVGVVRVTDLLGSEVGCCTCIGSELISALSSSVSGNSFLLYVHF